METSNNDNIQKYDTEHFHIRVLGYAPPKYAIVTENIFTAATNTLRSGLHLIAPWKKSVYVSLKAKTKDFAKKTFEARNKVDVEIDYAAEIKVIDPIKYTYSTNKLDKGDANDKTTPETMLESVIDDVLRELASRLEDDELLKLKFDINDHSDPMMQTIRYQLNIFANKYGLAVDSFNVKSINQIGEVSKKYQEQQFAKIDREKKIADEQAQLEITKMRAQAIAKMMQDLVASGMTREQAYEIIQTNLIKESPNAQWVNIRGGNEASNFGANFQAGANAVNGAYQKRK